jgi:hypothetical protein
MLQRLGDVIYWTASGLALLVVFYGGFFALIAAHLRPLVGGLVVAALIWLAGRAARYVLAG